MALEFKLADFAYPVSLLKLRAKFEKNQWFSSEQQTLYQEQLLRRIVKQAYRHVPYYRDLFDRMRLKPDDIRRVTDLAKIPVLTKQTLRDEYEKLKADNRHRFRPRTVCTSGSTGQRVQFLVDKPSNVLEFVYYWRHWNRAGYRLGNCFAEFSSVWFQKNKHKRYPFTSFQRGVNRLLLDSSKITAAAVDCYVAAIRKHRPMFLKGLPSVLYYFSLFLRERGIEDILFKAVFATGETLLPRYRKVIENTFRCKVYDSYGHMERTVAISECPHGGLHVNSDYGVLELVRQDHLRSGYVGNAPGSSGLAKVIGTSLYCYSMPLLRYEVGDVVQLETGKECECGCQFPLVRSIEGRQSDVIITPEGEVITAAFLVFEEVPEILAGQILQESIDELRVRIVPTSEFSSAREEQFKSDLRRLTGSPMRITLERCSNLESLHCESGKFRPVISRLDAVSTGIF